MITHRSRGLPVRMLATALLVVGLIAALAAASAQAALKRYDGKVLATNSGAKTFELSRKEFDLLERLMRDAGSVVTREQLIEDVRDMNGFGSTKTLDVHVSSLRKKLGDNPERTRFLHTVRGVGFRFSVAADLDE